MARFAMQLKPLEKTFLAFHGPEGSNVGDVEGEPELVFIACCTECQAPIFKAQSAAIPVVGRLRSRVLNGTQAQIIPSACGKRESSLRRTAISSKQTELVEV